VQLSCAVIFCGCMETDEEGFLASHFFMQLIAAVVLIFYSTLDSIGSLLPPCRNGNKHTRKARNFAGRNLGGRSPFIHTVNTEYSVFMPYKTYLLWYGNITECEHAPPPVFYGVYTVPGNTYNYTYTNLAQPRKWHTHWDTQQCIYNQAHTSTTLPCTHTRTHTHAHTHLRPSHTLLTFPRTHTLS